MVCSNFDCSKGGKLVMGEWNTDIERAFLELKLAQCQHPVLVSSDFSKQFIVQMDASYV